MEKQQRPVKHFEWNDLILTAKGWYESTDSLALDLAYGISANTNRSIVTWDNDERIAGILMNSVMPTIWKLLTEEELKSPCWLYRSDDFYRKIADNMRLYECDFNHAVLLAVHDVLCNCITKEHIVLDKPVYRRGRRRLGSIFHKYPKSMTYKQMNRIAEKHFGHGDEAECTERKVRFFVRDGRWYADVKGRTLEENEMVMGADTLLGCIADGRGEITLTLETEEPKCHLLHLHMASHDGEGATYVPTGSLYNSLADKMAGGEIQPFSEVWLCNVVHDIFGDHPKDIYVTKIE